MHLGLLFLLAVIALFIIMVGSSLYFTHLMKTMLFRHIHDLDLIRATGLPPPGWQKRRYNHHLSAQLKYNLKKLKSMERFVQKTNLVEDEPTRIIVLSELKEARLSWTNAANI